MIIRNFIKNLNQYVFDPEGEYLDICNSLNGEYISTDSNIKTNKYINILDITYEEIELYQENVLKFKIESLIEFIKDYLTLNFELVKKLKIAIKNSYLKYGISEKINSVYMEDKKDKIYVNKKLKSVENMPTLKDVYDEICKIKDSSNEFRKFKNDFNMEILNKLKCFCSKTTISKNKLIIYNIKNLNYNKSAILIKYLLNNICNIQRSKINNFKIKKDKIKLSYSLIYIDELWKYICGSSNYELASYIFELYKTIRKLNASIITITQDISDFFEYNNGQYGKSILNNSGFKIFFKFNFSHIEILNKLDIKESELKEIMKLEKGQAVIYLKNIQLKLNISSTEFERKMLGGN